MQPCAVKSDTDAYHTQQASNTQRWNAAQQQVVANWGYELVQTALSEFANYEELQKAWEDEDKGRFWNEVERATQAFIEFYAERGFYD